MKRLLAFWMFALFYAANSFAATYPDYTDEYVNDFAGVISDSDAELIRKLLSQVREQAKVEITVVTIVSLANYEAQTNLRSYASQLFDKWGVGDAKQSNGVMILFSLKDREVWIEMGAGYKKRLDAPIQEVVDHQMLPAFKNELYSYGLYLGAKGVTEVVTKPVSWFEYHMWNIIMGVLAAVCIVAGVSCFRTGKNGWGYAFFAIAGTLILFILKALVSRRGGFGGGRSGGGGAGGRW